ncbi:UDP-glucuronic acid decarboxylase 1 [Portunus trituberculatus]|uniref:UDP-glucuronic acid decarboxylase 1 n=1 Tax=Portunus trituberculatus TaxID=210409 RepID=A0A5B7HE97_PORTR|nr:UDP-glucuronic acid decarboxylase 1 [Portunus trituberculatus]
MLRLLKLRCNRFLGSCVIQHLSPQIYGSGKQTRSFQYVSDLVDGLIKLLNSNYSMPVNLGNPDEHTIEGQCCMPVTEDKLGIYVTDDAYVGQS